MPPLVPPGFELPAISAPSVEEPARIVAAPPLADALARGLVVIPYRTEHLRIRPVFGPAALAVVPRVGHLHITVDNAGWHWVDASGESIIIQGLAHGAHVVTLELADPTHRVLDRAVVEFEIQT